MRIMIALVLCLLVHGEAVAKQNIYDNKTRESATGTAFFMDRVGDLYPPPSVKLDTTRMDWTGADTPNADNEGPEFATLKRLYSWKSTRRNDPDWQALLAHTSVTQTGSFDADWTSVQDILRNHIANEISALGDQDDVTMLVHGYNNGYGAASDWYTKVERNLREAASGHGRRVAFVHMYWDGLEGRTPFFIWMPAQFNGYVVGLELRRILNRVDGDTPLRFFTHSSGAFVIANALGDGSSPADLEAGFSGDYVQRAAGTVPGYEVPTQLSDLRVAMLIPAVPPDAFHGYFRSRVGSSNEWIAAPGKPAAVPQRLVLGLSRHDFATSRLFLPCSLLGNVCMAVKVGESCHQVANDLKISKPQLQMVEFVQWPVHGHGVESYMDDEEWPQLTRALFAADPGEPEGTRDHCPFPTIVPS